MSNTPASTKSINDPAELNERELGQVAGGLVPAVAPAARKASVELVNNELVNNELIGLL